jgi:thiol-disulfide isomerase/thioredoxin
MKKIFTIVCATALFAGVGNAQISNYNVGETVDDFTVTDTHGEVHNLSTITAAGKYVYLDFFFTTCPPCQATAPIWNEFYDKYGCNTGDVYCITIDRGDSDNAAVDAYEVQYGGSFNHSPAISSEGGSAAITTNFGVSAFPTYCLIGPDMKVIEQDIYPINDVGTFEATFPSGFTPPVLACTTAGINENDLNVAQMSAFPNPSNGTIQLNVSSAKDVKATLEITNLMGQLVKTVQLNLINGSNSIDLDLTSLEAGNYVAKMIDQDNNASHLKIQITK